MTTMHQIVLTDAVEKTIEPPGFFSKMETGDLGFFGIYDGFMGIVMAFNHQILQV
jgi:hypothetical protein